MILPSPENPLVVKDSCGQYQVAEHLQDVAILPGAFNPLHIGHQKLRVTAERILGREVVFELSLVNVQKNLLDEFELTARLKQFANNRVAITCAAKFIDKASLFPGCWFVVGFDTAERILDPKFYNGHQDGMFSALNSLRERNHRFLVGGRLSDLEGSSQFCNVSDLDLPPELCDLFVAVEENEFREDISSSQLRSDQPGD